MLISIEDLRWRPLNNNSSATAMISYVLVIRMVTLNNIGKINQSLLQ
jgi:hypothetical protein